MPNNTTNNETENGVIKYDTDGLYTQEYCDMKLAELKQQAQVLRDEYKINTLTIKVKIQGQIRKAQTRNKQIREELSDINIKTYKYYNKGVY